MVVPILNRPSSGFLKLECSARQTELKTLLRHPLLLLLSCAFVWCYFFVGIDLVRTWIDTPDYSHGFFVFPVAVMIAWSRRDSIPAEFNPSFPFLFLLLFGLAARWAGVAFTIEPIAHFSILISLAGLVGFVGGRKLFWWSLPMIAYLVFMIRLPYSIAVTYAAKLQWLSAQGASYLLRAAGFPALADGNVIQM